MKIAVLGGTGTLGRRLVAVLGRDPGHAVRALSRSAAEFPVDLVTGAGLEAALDGCEVVIDASNGPPSGKARAVLVDGTRHVLEVGQRVGVRHHVCVSIVGIEDVPMAYYRVKLEQEQVVQSGGVPWTILRATQFHDLLGALLSAAGRRHLSPGVKARFQPVGVDDVAEAAAEVGTGPPRMGTVTVAGPEVHDLRSLGRMWRQATGRRTIEIPLPMPGKVGRALREGRLTCPHPDVRGTQTFAEWLSAGSG